MFKLVKIPNAGVNVPEPEKLPCQFNFNVEAGCCVVYNPSLNLLAMGDQMENPTHILVHNAKKGDKTAICYRISPDMIFETTLVGSPAELHEGMTVEFALNNTHGAYGISDIKSGPAIIYSLDGATKSGDKVLVTLKVQNYT